MKYILFIKNVNSKLKYKNKNENIVVMDYLPAIYVYKLALGKKVRPPINLQNDYN